MALTLQAQTTEVLTVEEFVDYVSRSIDVDDVDSLCTCAPAFKALLNNRSLVTDLIDRELRSWRDFQNGNAYVSTTLILARTPRYFLRVNIWLPDSKRSRAHGDSAIYGLTHDHNFTFMTGGYQGAGYTTEIYEAPAEAAGLPGEHVRLNFLEQTTLPPGKIMVYRAVHDVHRQSRPDELSVSLNLVVPGFAANRPQYFFDLDRSVVSHTEYPERGRALALLRLAGFAGDARTRQLLYDIASTSPNARLRTAAFETLCDCDRAAAQALYEPLGRDPDPHVRAAVQANAPKVLPAAGPVSH